MLVALSTVFICQIFKVSSNWLCINWKALKILPTPPPPPFGHKPSRMMWWSFQRKGAIMIRENLKRAISPPLCNTYLKDISTLEAELIVCGSFEIVFGDGFHARAAGWQQWWAGWTAKALSLQPSPRDSRLSPCLRCLLDFWLRPSHRRGRQRGPIRPKREGRDGTLREVARINDGAAPCASPSSTPLCRFLFLQLSLRSERSQEAASGIWRGQSQHSEKGHGEAPPTPGSEAGRPQHAPRQPLPRTHPPSRLRSGCCSLVSLFKAKRTHKASLRGSATGSAEADLCSSLSFCKAYSSTHCRKKPLSPEVKDRDFPQLQTRV